MTRLLFMDPHHAAWASGTMTGFIRLAKMPCAFAQSGRDTSYVAAIERKDLGRPKMLGRGDQGSIGKIQ